jgi:CDP-glycerol glycerophosphotransferase (TagB/SpsB family)
VSDDLWKPFKHLELDKHIKNRYDLLCLVGKHMEEKFRELNLLTDTNWKPVGFPRLDCVINNELSRDEILNDLNLDPKLKTVLYAPTWRGHQEMNLSSIPDMGLEICESIDENMNFIFKPHPIVKKHNEFPEIIEQIETHAKNQKHNEFPEIIEQIETHAKNQQNFVYPDAFTEIIPLLYVSDLLITDFSTVAIEYLAFDRPIIFADHLGEVYNDPNLVEVMIREAGEIVRNPNEFKNAIWRCLESPSEKSEIRRRYRDYFFYTLDGKASERATKAIIELE